MAKSPFIITGVDAESLRSAESPRALEPSAAPLLEDWLYRQSSLVDAVVNKRWGVLYADCFVTFRKPQNSKPSKKLRLAGCTLSGEVQSGPYKVRKQHRNTVWALATGSVEERQLYHFRLQSAKQNTLVVCFEDAATAERWHAVLSGLLQQNLMNSMRSSNSSMRGKGGWSKSGMEGGGTHSRRPSAADNNLLASFQPCASDDGCKLASHFADQDCSDREADACTARNPECSPRDTESERPPGCRFDDFTRKWRSVAHVNGVAVYAETEQGVVDGSKMVAVPVRCTPESCFKAVMRFAFERCEVVEVVDAHTSVLRATVGGSWLMAPREFLLLRTWKRDTDGSYIVLLQDAKATAVERAAAEAAAALEHGWTDDRPAGYKNRRAQVESAGIIIAPLAPEYAASGRQTECLVTTVAKVDLGGWLAKGGWLGRMLAASPLDAYTTSSWLHPLVSRVINLRDLVEQERFLRKPFECNMTRARSTEGSLSLSPSVSPAADPAAQQAAQPPSARSTFAPPVPSFRGPSMQLTQEELEQLQLHRNEASTSAKTGAAAHEASVEQERWAGGTLPSHAWTCPGAAGFKLRGPTYLADRKKLPAQEPVFALAAVDVIKMGQPCPHISRFLPSLRYSEAPFTFVLNIMVPSTPFFSLVISWAAAYVPDIHSASSGPLASAPGSTMDDDESDSDCDGCAPSPFDRCMARFLAGGNAARDAKFKLIPRIPEGSWVIKQSVGTTPVILGRKLNSQYFSGDGYFEMAIDIGSSSVAASVVNLVHGATKSLVIDMAVLFEGQEVDELPEQLLGTVRLVRMDLSKAPWLEWDESGGRVLERQPATRR